MTHRFIVRALFALACAFGLTAAAGAATYYVDQGHPSASDSNPGTKAAPMLTISGAMSALDIQPGDTVRVKAGIYRDRFGLKGDGTPEEPKVLMAEPGHEVVLSGADEITGWQPCTEAIVEGNPDYASLWYVDINWNPGNVYQDNRPFETARLPNYGWWMVTDGSDISSLVDDVNLTQPDDYWNGAKVYMWYTTGNAQYTRAISDFDQATGTIYISGTWNPSRIPRDGRDRYCLLNSVKIIDGEGDCVIRDLGDGSYRIVIWPFNDADPNTRLMEGPRRDRFIIEWNGDDYWTIDGFEIRHGAAHGVGSFGGTHGITLENCSVHHNNDVGVYLTATHDSTFRRCLVGHNGGQQIKCGGTNITIEECEVGPGTLDGITAITDRGYTIRRCYVHDHWKQSHPDNLQCWDDAADINLVDSLIVHAGQCFMVGGCDGMTVTGNIIVGSRANMFAGGANVNNVFRNNTFWGSGYACIATGNNYTIEDNIAVPGHNYHAWQFESGNTFTLDHNLFWLRADIAQQDVLQWGTGRKTLAEFQAITGQELNSQNADPMFTSAPYGYYVLDLDRQQDHTATRVYIRGNETAGVTVGDQVEINFDGVLRTVTAVGGGAIDFTPPKPDVQSWGSCLLNWKDAAAPLWDLTPAPGSPAIGLASDGGTVGATINYRQFAMGDFTGDWVRDIPSWSADGSADALGIVAWQILADHGPAGVIATPIYDNSIEPRRGGLQTFRIAFSRGLDPATVTSGSVTIVGQTGGDQAALIDTVSMTAGGSAIEVALSAPLPDADRYTVTVATTVRAADGTELSGDRDLTCAALAGDVDASGTVSGADAVDLRGRIGQAVNVATARYDVDRSGTLTGADMRAAAHAEGNTLP